MFGPQSGDKRPHLWRGSCGTALMAVQFRLRIGLSCAFSIHTPCPPESGSPGHHFSWTGPKCSLSLTVSKEGPRHRKSPLATAWFLRLDVPKVGWWAGWGMQLRGKMATEATSGYLSLAVCFQRPTCEGPVLFQDSSEGAKSGSPRQSVCLALSLSLGSWLSLSLNPDFALNNLGSQNSELSNNLLICKMRTKVSMPQLSRPLSKLSSKCLVNSSYYPLCLFLPPGAHLGSLGG